MSPQQMEGHRPCSSDDLYALGASLYDLLTSRPPFFSGDVVYQVQEVPAKAIAERLAELGIRNPVPEHVAAAILACLAKDVAARPQSAREVAGRLGLSLDALSPRGASASGLSGKGDDKKPASELFSAPSAIDRRRSSVPFWKRCAAAVFRSNRQ